MRKSMKSSIVGTTVLVGLAALALFAVHGPSELAKVSSSQVPVPAVASPAQDAVSQTSSEPSLSDKSSLLGTDASAANQFPLEIGKQLADESVMDEVLNRQIFFSAHNAGLRKWRTYSEVQDQLCAQFPQSAELSVDSTIERAEDLLHRFWEDGDFSNPDGWRTIYAARLLAERALERDSGKKDERLWTLLENIIISAVPADCPYSTPGGPSFDQQCFKIKQDGLQDIFKVSTLHFLGVITEKPLKDVTRHDMAVANRILRASVDRSIDEMLFSVPEIAEMVGFDPRDLEGFTVGALQEKVDSSRIAVRKILNKRVASWMIDASKVKGWETIGQEAEAALAALEEGKQPPIVPPLYINNILSLFPTDHDGFLRYDRFVDGLTLEYRGKPAYVPRF